MFDQAPGDFWDYLSQLLNIVHSSDVRELELSDGDTRLRVHRTPNVEPEDRQFGEDSQSEVILDVGTSTIPIAAGLVGTFYRAEHPGSPPFVEEGTEVQEDTVVGIIEALSVLTEVEAGCRGVITGVLATDGQPVEYGQHLFEVMPGE